MSTSQRYSYDYPDAAIPLELLQHILQYLPKYELLRICALSRGFNEEVVRILYHHVDLVNSTFPQYMTFTSHVALRHDHAQLIRVLSLPSGIYGKYQLSTNLRYNLQLPSALQAMNNLTSLFIVDGFHVQRDCGRYLHGDDFLGCTFRLRTFRNASVAWTRNTLLPFLHEQNQIQDLATAYNYDLEPDPRFPTATLLPNLSILSICYCSKPTHLASRRLSRLRLEMAVDNTQRDVECAMQSLALAPASKNLTHLYFHFTFHSKIVNFDLGEAQHVKAMVSIASALPNLEFLRYSDAFRLDLDPSPWDWEAFPRALSAFKWLKVLVLDVLDDGHISRRARSNGHILAGRCMASCPTLRSVAITGIVRNKSTNPSPQHISFTRDSDTGSGMSVSGFQAVEESAWRDI